MTETTALGVAYLAGAHVENGRHAELLAECERHTRTEHGRAADAVRVDETPCRVARDGVRAGVQEAFLVHRGESQVVPGHLH